MISCIAANKTELPPGIRNYSPVYGAQLSAGPQNDALVHQRQQNAELEQLVQRMREEIERLRQDLGSARRTKEEIAQMYRTLFQDSDAKLTASQKAISHLRERNAALAEELAAESSKHKQWVHELQMRVSRLGVELYQANSLAQQQARANASLSEQVEHQKALLASTGKRSEFLAATARSLREQLKRLPQASTPSACSPESESNKDPKTPNNDTNQPQSKSGSGCDKRDADKPVEEQSADSESELNSETLLCVVERTPEQEHASAPDESGTEACNPPSAQRGSQQQTPIVTGGVVSAKGGQEPEGNKVFVQLAQQMLESHPLKTAYCDVVHATADVKRPIEMAVLMAPTECLVLVSPFLDTKARSLLVDRSLLDQFGLSRKLAAVAPCYLLSIVLERNCALKYHFVDAFTKAKEFVRIQLHKKGLSAEFQLQLFAADPDSGGVASSPPTSDLNELRQHLADLEEKRDFVSARNAFLGLLNQSSFPALKDVIWIGGNSDALNADPKLQLAFQNRLIWPFTVDTSLEKASADFEFLDLGSENMQEQFVRLLAARILKAFNATDLLNKCSQLAAPRKNQIFNLDDRSQTSFEGGYSNVKICKALRQVPGKLADGSYYAVKTAGTNLIWEKQLRNELAILQTLNHPSVVKLAHHYIWNSQLHLVLECIDGGTLRDKMRQLSQRQLLQIFLQIAQGLAYLHREGVVHGDIKPDNVLLQMIGGNYQCKICDFGNSTRRDAKGKWTRAQPGHASFSAPETSKSKLVTPKTDVFAFAILMCVSCFGIHPFAEKNNDYSSDTGRCTVEQNIQNGKINTAALKMFSSPRLRALVARMLHLDHKQRPTMAKVEKELQSIITQQEELSSAEKK